MCTGAPCTCGIRPVTCTAVATSPAGIGRIDTTSGPDNRPAGRHSTEVLYIDTFRPCSRFRTGTPASSSAVSKLKLQPIRKLTRSSRHSPVSSLGSSTSSPSRQTRYCGRSVRRSASGASVVRNDPASVTSSSGTGRGLRWPNSSMS
jgi:hypothetical protein